ncbi:MAG TPA: UDP-N-acetylmuramate dehydrogenase [Usitatibacter sp.]|jgi:UDP-N-acetylmuramate dehydrogenase|nr:UDP-N-acetylmuramate dehydrogenase [Usitatibacter sp.]
MDMSDSHRFPGGLRGTLTHDEPMAKHVTWRAGGAARTAYRPADVTDLCAFLRALAPEEPVLFVGLGSNLLVRDGGFAGTVVFTHHALTGIGKVNGRSYSAGAGVPAPHLARFVAKHGGGGAEWMAGVPGTVGGALAMNAGCYGGETWNHVVFAETVDRSGTVRTRVRDDYDIGYRHVELNAHRDEWFIGARFTFPDGDEKASMARIRELLAKRVASQPLDQPNAGSVFRNPPGDHAARLIESSGLKGYAVGGAQVSTRHANFIVNAGGASAADIEAVVDHVQDEVFARTGIELVREVRIVGGGA